MISHSNTSLSAAQKRIWFDCQSGDVLQNHVVLAYELNGEFSPSLMQQALSQLILEHDTFRTTIFSTGKNLERFVHEHMKVELKCLSLDPYSDIYPTIQHLVKKPFNIATGPLFRFNLLQKSPKSSILLLVFHRIIINACVLKKIVKELSKHYQSFFHQQTSLIESRSSYDDFVAYEKKYREAPHYRDTIRHWSSRIKDKQFHLDLTKLPESEENHSQVGSKRITLDEKFHKKIIRFCETFSCTPENIFLTVLQTLLYRYTDTQDIVINRPEEIIYKEEWEKLLGPTGNIIPWNVRLNANMNFLDLLAQNQQFDRYKKYYPHAHIADIVRTVRSRFNHHFDGFFSNVSFDQETIPFHELILPQVNVHALPQYIHRTRIEELQVFFDEYNNHFFLSFDYTAKISSKAIQNFATHYECLIENLLKDPTQKLSEVNFLPLETIQKLLGSSTFSPPHYPDIITLFEKAVEIYPNHIAVIDEKESLTYEQLNQASNQLAHALKSQRVQSNHCIGLALGRNVRMVIATLGILKAGNAYVPLDPAYPKERLTYMMQDANISLVITEKSFESLIKSCHSVETFLLNKQLKNLHSFSKENLSKKPQLEDLAYVIYTSGSTGNPKGVLVPHRGLPNLAAYQQTLFSLEPKTRCLQAGSINFDITAFELFAPLIFGGTLYIANDDQRRSPLKLQEFIIQKKIEIVVTTPSVLSHFEWISMPEVRVITVCGEACEQKLMDFWAHGRTFINGYGPTEITMGSHFKVYEPNTLFNNLGPVVPNVRAFILDSNKNLLPDGIPGELYVGGVGVANGYLNLPEQTQEKFIPNPFDSLAYRGEWRSPSEKADGQSPLQFEDIRPLRTLDNFAISSRNESFENRSLQDVNENSKKINDEEIMQKGQFPKRSILYRTNDIAYRLENGDFMYLGRNDDQVKIRGLRVELGEIEEKIKTFPDIERVLVRALSHDTLGKVLVAYFIQDTFKKNIEESVLRDYLHSCLPEHMVPTYLIQVPHFPIMRNGKIDYQALPNPFNALEHFDHEQCSKIEQVLIKIFAELFSIDEKSISLDHDFFALGGHSLLATQMIARIQQNLKLQLPVGKVFELRTIKKFSEYLSILQDDNTSLLSLISLPENTPIPLSYAQRLLWFFFQLDKNSSLYNIPFLIRFKKANKEYLIRAFHHIIEQNAVLRTIFEETEEDEPIQKILPSLDFKIPVYESPELFFNEMSSWDKKPFDLIHGPLFRAAMTNDGKDILLYLNIHHIIFDGWSFKVFMEQLAKTYEAIQKKSPLPSLISYYSYADFIYSQRQWVKEGKLSKELSYWQHLLQGATTSLDLPTDFPYPKQRKYTGSAIAVDLSSTLTLSLKELALENQTTLFSVLLTAYFILLYRYTKQADILIGTPIANRFQAELEPIIGFLVNVSIYRQQLSNKKTFHELLQSVHQNACDAADNQALPFDVLLNSLDILFDPKQNPLFQAMFSLQTGHKLAGTLGKTGVDYIVDEKHAEGAKADILMALNEMEDGSLHGYVEYRTDLFTEASILHLREHYNNLLQAIVENPTASIAELTILSYEEYECLVKKWPYGEKKPLPTKTVLEKVKESTDYYNDLPALKFKNQTLTYAHFWHCVEYIAKEIDAIKKQIIGDGKQVFSQKDTIIGILMPRGPEMIITMCAIWKANAAFLPLDADYPDDRLRYMLEDSGAKIIISVPELKEKYDAFGKDIHILEVTSTIHIPIKNKNKKNQTAHYPSFHSLAYIIYTSGSTGHPKGVALEHTGLSNVINYVVDLYQLRANRRVLQFTSINFDASIKEIFSALVSGACLYIVDSDMRRSPEKLQEFIGEQKIQIASLQPVVLESFEKKPIPGLEIIDIGGDACDTNTINFWQNHCRLLNTYGPTETSIICSTKHYDTPVVTQNIGRPLYNTEMFILDEELNPVPTGVIGELFVGGIGLARGYWNREKLTFEKFILHPFSDDPNARLYRTGDYARWLPNGELDFIGRIDNQVKIRGYRIETGEIETLLNAYPSIKQAVVIAKKEQQILIAYFTHQEDINSDQLHAYLAETLPEYMIPSAFISMDVLPLNLSGKIDRKALQAEDFRTVNLVRSFVEPANEIEKILCNIWKEILKTEQLGVENSFFELGGHSLTVTQMISRVKKQLKLNLPITQVFELRTIRRIADYLFTLKKESKESLALWHSPKKNRGPLSYAQKQMLFLYELDPTSVVYNIPMLMRFEEVNSELLVKSLYYVLEKNPIFRTVIDNTEEEPVQVVRKKAAVNIPFYESIEMFRAEIKQWDNTPFDLINGPVFRAAFSKENKTTFVYFNIHHIAFDGWSTSLLMQQWMANYKALANKKDLPSFKTDYQYLDYAYSQNRWLAENRLASQLEFWKKFLHGAQTTLDLPIDFPYPEHQSFEGNIVTFSLAPSLAKSLKDLANTHNTTVSAVLLAAFFALLYRYTKQADIIIGVPIAGRYHPGLEPILGFFINESIYRQQLSPHQSFSDLLKSVHQNACDAADNQALPFNEILDKLNIPVDPKRNPLFQVLFDYQAVLPSGNDASNNIYYSFEERNYNTAKLDLTLSLGEMPNGSIQGGVEYRTDLFTEISMQHLCGHYRNLLEEIIKNPDAPCVSYTILTSTEYKLLAQVWPNGKQLPLPEKTVLEMIEDTVKKYPDTPALKFNLTTLTYAEFWIQVEVLATHIGRHCEERSDAAIQENYSIIGLLMPRGPEMIIAMCAIWKVGAAFLPLDADYPDERLRYMAKDSDTHIIVSLAELREKQPIFENMDVLFVEVDAGEREGANSITEQALSLNRRAVHHQDLAYIIYTSGSTGNPKGVLLNHLGLSNIIQCIRDMYNLQPATHVLQFSSINFDASMGEIFSALISGASLYIVDSETRRSTEKLQHFIDINKIQIASLQPAILESFERKPLKSLEIVDIGGDACDTHTLNFWRHHCRLLNTYGPTETTIICAAKHYNAPAIAQNIGRPLYNTQLFIVDEYFNPVPTGVMGEIFIGGAGLARGYLNQEHLTKERFVPHFLSKDPNARLYRTGDYGRWLTNGEIEFIGRIDNQVKIRGYRIEMGEIEALLNSHPSIKQAIVIAQKELQILVAYFTFKKEIVNDQLRQYLTETLPEYMIPAAFIPLDALPLNLSGKIDRKALQTQDFRLFSPIQAFVQPTNAIELSLCEIWKDILKTEQFGIDNSFFELGGHSLLITQMISRVKKNLKLTLSIATVFELRTIRKLSEYLLTQQQESKENLTLWHTPENNKAPLSYAQKQMWFFYQLNPHTSVYNIPMLMRFKNANQARLIQAFYQVIEQNPIFRTVIDNSGEEPMQMLLKKPHINFPIYDSLEQFHEDIKKWDITPFDLVNGRVFRLALAKEVDDILVYFNVHHIAFDGWSTGILMQQLNTLYIALEKNKPLPKLATQYSYLDYAYSQNRWLEENRLAEQAAFWQHFLQDAQTTLDLPTDFPYPSKPSFSGNTLTFTLPASLVNALKNIATNNNTTLFSVTLAAFFALLYRYTKQDDIIIGAPIAGRYHTALEPIMGFFVNESIYRQRLSKIQTFNELVSSVHQNACDTAENQALPFNEILDKLNLPVDPSKNPLFQVLFNYLALDPIENQTHLNYQFEERSHTGAKLDITLSIGEMPDGSLQTGVEYRTDLFTELSMQHLCGHYQNLLQEIVANPDAALGSYRILSEAEYELLVNQWPHGEKRSLPEKTALDMIKEAVNKYADSAALIFENNIITYTSFWEKVTTLAHLIESYPVFVEANNIRPLIIGLLMPRGIEMIIAMCAVWKVGGAFLPLDAEYPDDRLQYMVKDSDTHLIVSVAALKEKQKVFEEMDVVFVEVDAPTENVIPRSVLNASEAPQYKTRRGNPEKHLAYIIYTSGSTGNPKGVMVKHQGLSNLIPYLQDIYQLQTKMQVLQFTSINFDVSIAEIFPALVSGATLHIVHQKTRHSVSDLQQYIHQKHIQLVSIPPAVLELFEHTALPTVETIIIGGDTCDSRVINYWKQHCRLINGYGPTEATVYALTKQFEADTHSTTIGRPLYNVETFILDEDLHPVPTGIRGELFIGGMGLAAGYLNRDELTQEKFISHPFSPYPEAKLYRSGDYARWLPNGEIEFIGRIDNQVKIRGYRIEIGEIEALLNAYAGIKQAVVIAKKEQQILIAYLTSKKEINAEIIRAYLVDKLPEYMIPAAFIQLASFPINLSGKIDRKILQAKDFRLLNHIHAFVKPSSNIEKTLWMIWEELLKTDQFGIDNSFFELGGHSLLVTQMISRVKKHLKLNLSIAKIFEQRTIRNIAHHLSTLQKEIQDNLSLLHAPESNKAPLSYAQKQMWFFYQLNPHSAAYNMPMLMRFKNANANLLVQTLQHIINQNAIFRTIIDATGNEPQQVILPKVDIDIAYYDTKDFYKHSDQWDILPFDLENGPVFRAAFTKDNKDTLFYFNIHHIAFDGWSSDIFIQQIFSTYAALEKNHSLPLFNTEYQYIDYAYSQNHWLENNFLQDQLDFWKRYLQDAQTTLDLPTDFPYPQEQNFKGNTLDFQVNLSLSEQLKFIATENNTTLFSVMLAAFFALLYRYTKQDDIIIGVPIAGRYRASLEPIIGFFVNESIYRQGLSNKQTFRELLKSVHQNACDAAENQILPFNEILDNLNIPVDPKKNPLFQVLFNYQALNVSEKNSDTKLMLEFEDRPSTISKLDITLSVAETLKDGLHLSIEYRTDLFTELSMQHLGAHYQNLLNEIVNNPDASLVSYAILSKPEYELLVDTWPYGKKEPLPKQTVLEMVEEIAKKHENSLALVFEEQSLTYGEFWEKVITLAHVIESYLVLVGENNIRPLIIGMLMPRGPDMIVAMCAIWKVGGAFLPLDADYPDDRLFYMVQDSDTHIIVSVSELKDKWRIFEGMDVVFVEGNAPTENLIARSNDALCGSIFKEESHSDDSSLNELAYIIYTSGSTGSPKGVMIEHLGLSNVIMHMQRAYQLPTQTKKLQFASINFDNAMVEIFFALSSEHTLFIANNKLRRSISLLQHYLLDNDIEFISIPPAVLESFEKKKMSNLKIIDCGGDTCDPEVIDYWKTQCSVINGYGPTEATIISSSKIYTTESSSRNIGRPLDNTEIFILDEDFHPVPTGVMGEILIGGIGLARGYLNREALTKEKFISHPFSQNPADRLYRTGDYGRWLPTGDIEFIGRIDNQVKLRGYRIEIGEIEALLNTYPGIKQCVVIAKKEQQILIAYFSGKKGIKHTQLKKYLAEKLPEYMIPAAFIHLESLPLSLSGKIDRKSLQAKDFRLVKKIKSIIKPRNEQEQQLWNIWTQLFKFDQISIKDSFFDLGGHSLLASKLSSQFKATYHQDCPVSTVFQYKTIEAIAKNLNATVDQTSLMLRDIQQAKNKLQQFELPTILAHQPPHVILMTGAHGFLGAHILERLLQDTHVSIICLVRTRTQKELKQKVKKDLARFNLEALSEHPQIEWLKGDLSQPMLGLNTKTYHTLCKTVDSVYHSGAWVNHILDYQNLRATNVDSTITLLEMCATHQLKTFNYISTTNVGEVFQHPNAIEHFSGYIQSKWVSENIVLAAQKQGIPARIFRPGNITGHSKTGICVAENNHALSLIKSCIQLGIAPIWEYSVEMMPVDYVSEAIVRYTYLPTSLTHNNIPLDLSNIHSLSWKTYMQYLNKLGLKVQMVSFVEWQTQLNTISEDNALSPFKTLYTDMSPEAAQTVNEESQHPDILQDIDLYYPEDYQALVGLYWTYLKKIGFLDS